MAPLSLPKGKAKRTTSEGSQETADEVKEQEQTVDNQEVSTEGEEQGFDNKEVCTEETSDKEVSANMVCPEAKEFSPAEAADSNSIAAISYSDADRPITSQSAQEQDFPSLTSLADQLPDGKQSDSVVVPYSTSGYPYYPYNPADASYDHLGAVGPYQPVGVPNTTHHSLGATGLPSYPSMANIVATSCPPMDPTVSSSYQSMNPTTTYPTMDPTVSSAYPPLNSRAPSYPPMDPRVPSPFPPMNPMAPSFPHMNPTAPSFPPMNPTSPSPSAYPSMDAPAPGASSYQPRRPAELQPIATNTSSYHPHGSANTPSYQPFGSGSTSSYQPTGPANPTYSYQTMGVDKSGYTYYGVYPNLAPFQPISPVNSGFFGFQPFNMSPEDLFGAQGPQSTSSDNSSEVGSIWRPPHPPQNGITGNLASSQSSRNSRTSGNSHKGKGLKFHRGFKPPKCAFCRQNGEEVIDHLLKDDFGNVLCPVLSSYKCRLCGSTGSNAHTYKYCPMNPYTRGDPVTAGFLPGISPPHFNPVMNDQKGLNPEKPLVANGRLNAQPKNGNSSVLNYKREPRNGNASAFEQQTGANRALLERPLNGNGSFLGRPFFNTGSAKERLSRANGRK